MEQPVYETQFSVPTHQCCYCKAGFVMEDLRPYGPMGQLTCHACGMKPENKETTEFMFAHHLNGIVDGHRVAAITNAGLVALPLKANPLQEVAAAAKKFLQ